MTSPQEPVPDNEGQQQQQAPPDVFLQLQQMLGFMQRNMENMENQVNGTLDIMIERIESLENSVGVILEKVGIDKNEFNEEVKLKLEEKNM